MMFWNSGDELILFNVNMFDLGYHYVVFLMGKLESR